MLEDAETTVWYYSVDISTVPPRIVRQRNPDLLRVTGGRDRILKLKWTVHHSLRRPNHPRSTAFPNVPLYLQSSCRKHEMNNSDVIKLFCYLFHPVFTVPLLVSSEGVGEAPPRPLLHLHAFHSNTVLSDPHHLSPFLISLFLHPPPQ